MEPGLQAAAASLRTVVVLAAQLEADGGLAGLARALAQHPRMCFVVVINSFGTVVSSGGNAAVGAEVVAAPLSCADGFSWPPNAHVVAGFSDWRANSVPGTKRWWA